MNNHPIQPLSRKSSINTKPETEDNRLLEELDNNDGFWSREHKRLGAAIQCMITAIGVFSEQGYDPIEMCKLLMDDDNNERVIGRRLYEHQT